MTRGKVEELKQADDLVLQKGEIVIDAIFGSGLNRPVTGLAARIIKQMNASANRVVAVDIPSGLVGRIIPGTIPKPLFVQSIPLLFSSRS